MIGKYALMGLGIALFAAVISFLVLRENKRILRHKKELRELPKLFDINKEKKRDK